MGNTKRHWIGEANPGLSLYKAHRIGEANPGLPILLSSVPDSPAKQAFG